MNDTLEIAKLMSNSEELINYYTPTTIDESGEIKYLKHVPNYGQITTKLTRRNQFKSMLRTNELVSLEKYPRNGKERNDEEVCDVEKSHSIDKMKQTLKVKDLKIELKNHGLKISGKKTDLQARLIEHYESHHS